MLQRKRVIKGKDGEGGTGVSKTQDLRGKFIFYANIPFLIYSKYC